MAVLPVIWGDGVISPVSVLLKLIPATNKFLCRPTNSSDEGWGYPWIDPQTGERLPLGTLGGQGQTKIVMKRKGQWAKSSTPGNLFFGNIDWKGPELRSLPDGTKEHLRLTWNGPQNRYFPDPFYDDSEDKAMEVYRNGYIVCVAPDPILGAGARKYTPQNPNDPDDQEEWRLYVICKKGNDDVVYGYVLNLTGYTLTELDTPDPVSGKSIRQQMGEKWDKDENPYGYRELFNLPKQVQQSGDQKEEAKAARTPWFFNESCDKAVCMREMEVEYKDINDKDYTDDSLSKYRLTVGDFGGTGFDFEYIGQLGMLKYAQDHNYYQFLDPGGNHWCSFPCTYPFDSDNDDVECNGDNIDDHPDIPCSPGCPDMHLWHHLVIYRMQQTRYIIGSQIVAVDFDKDTEVTARLEVETIHTHQQEYTWGIDCDNWYAEPITTDGINQDCLGYDNYDGLDNCPDPNGCENDGKPMCSNNDTNPPYFGDRAIVPWIGGKAKYLLKFTNTTGDKEFEVYWDIYGTQFMKDNGYQRDEFDVYFEYHGYKKRFMHFMDLRHPFTFIFTELNLDEFPNFNDTVATRFDRSKGDLSSQLFQKEGIAIDIPVDVEPNYLSEKKISDVTETAKRLMGYDWVGKPSTTGPKANWGGPDWTLSEDIAYTHSDDGDRHFWQTEFPDYDWQEVQNRNEDWPFLQPLWEDWYDAVKPNYWQKWKSFFYHEEGHIEDQLDDTTPVYLVHVNGGFARHDDDWLLSYEEPADAGDTLVDQLVGADEFHNLITEDDSLYLFDGAEKHYPIGVY